MCQPCWRQHRRWVLREGLCGGRCDERRLPHASVAHHDDPDRSSRPHVVRNPSTVSHCQGTVSYVQRIFIAASRHWKGPDTSYIARQCMVVPGAGQVGAQLALSRAWVAGRLPFAVQPYLNSIWVRPEVPKSQEFATTINILCILQRQSSKYSVWLAMAIAT